MNMVLRTNWLIAMALVGWLVWLLAPVLTPFIVATLLAYTGNPFADRLESFNLPRPIAVIVVFLLTFLGLGLLVLLVVPLIHSQVAAFLTALPAIVLNAEQVWLPNLTGLFGWNFDQGIGLGAFIARYSDVASNWAGTILVSLSNSGGALVTGVISLFLVPILTFYLLRDWNQILARMSNLVPAAQRDTILQLVREADEVLGAFLRGQLLVMTSLAIIYSIGLNLVGLEFSIAIGVVAGLVSFVPYLGFICGILLASLTVMLEPTPLVAFAGVAGTFALGQFLESTILTPKFVGDRIGLHPVAVIFAIAAGGQLFGFFGILLALPVAAILSVLLRFVYNAYLLRNTSGKAVTSSAPDIEETRN